MMPTKTYIRNVILVMSGGIGARFGTDCPKQYNYMNGRPVIDYVIDAAKRSSFVDEIVIVASGDYVEYCRSRFNVPVAVGGKTRPESVANGLRYIHENYDCDKLIITNAVCPLASTEQYDKYFRLLDDYDFVLTTWKLAPALHRFDGVKVDRDNYFNVMEPDAYRFRKLYDSFDFENMHKYIFHNMPDDSKAYYCFDYPYTTKVTYQFDIPALEVLYNLLIEKPKSDHTLQLVNKYLSSDGTAGIESWITQVQYAVEEIAHKYNISNYSLNTQTQANIVYEGESSVYGDLIIKFTPSEYFYHKEFTYYQLSSGSSYMPLLTGYDEDYHALIIQKVKPGIQVKYHKDNTQLRRVYDEISSSLIPCEALKGDKVIPYFTDEFAMFSKCADKHRFEYSFRKALEKKAEMVWNCYFKNAPMFFLHGDVQRRNILSSYDRVYIIDPRGTIAPREFEYVIQFITELREDMENYNLTEKFNEMLDYFSCYCNDKENLKAALFIFWAHKMNDYIFHKNDNYKLARWCKDCLLKLFFCGDIETAVNENCAPEGIKLL